jgi:replicative superfamily II helicase
MDESELDGILETIRDASLKHTLSFGIGLHHAGLSDGDRQVVENLFGANKIQVSSFRFLNTHNYVMINCL